VVIQKRKAGGLAKPADSALFCNTAGRNNDSSINISNWRLVSPISGKNLALGEAVHLIFSGSVNERQSVIFRPGDTAYVTTGRSPVGYSFLVNKCSGYFTQFQKFYPSLSKKCPLPKDEILDFDGDQSIFIDNQCMDFVNRIRRCTVSTAPTPLWMSSACQEAIVEEINYNSCIEKHKNDADFRVPEWRLYLRRDSELWREKREIIKLLDENGKTVDYITY